jgi:hypothetical protein
MSRAQLTDAIRSRDGTVRALVPLIARHAARLEQMEPARLWDDPAAAAVCLGTVARLYPVDAVTPVVDVGLLVDAVRSAREDSDDEGTMPSPDRVLEQPGPAAVPAIVRRMRPVLATATGIAVVMPSPSVLAASLGHVDAGWASTLVMGWLRSFGPDQPDVFLELLPPDGTGPADAGVLATADHFDVPIVPLSGGSSGVVALDQPAITGGDAHIPPGTWLVTTDREIDADADPSAVRSGLERLRAET